MKIPLSQHIQTLGNREELVGLKVWRNDKNKQYTITRLGKTNNAVWGKNRLDLSTEVYLGIRNLSIDLTEQEK